MQQKQKYNPPGWCATCLLCMAYGVCIFILGYTMAEGERQFEAMEQQKII